jgi:hypothetical protein
VIFVCPFCGTDFPEGLRDGVANCAHCNRVFDNSLPNRLLAASWLARKRNYYGIQELISDTRLSEVEAILVYSLVSENLYSHDEVLIALRQLDIIRTKN